MFVPGRCGSNPCRPLEFAVLVFRGTERFKDILEDLRVGVKLVTAPNEPAVHEGFEQALDLVWPDSEAELARPNGPIFYTGHSLGAALATLAPGRRHPKTVYTFGSPRVGNDRFADSRAGLPMHRVVDDEDVGTTVPPEELGYAHVGSVRILRAPALSLAERMRLLFGSPEPLADHAPINYADRTS